MTAKTCTTSLCIADGREPHAQIFQQVNRALGIHLASIVLTHLRCWCGFKSEYTSDKGVIKRTMGDLAKLYRNLYSLPVRQHLQEWLSAVKQLISAGDYARAKLVLSTILQAHPESTEAHMLLVKTCLQLGTRSWPEALKTARCSTWGSMSRQALTLPTFCCAAHNESVPRGQPRQRMSWPAC